MLSVVLFVVCLFSCLGALPQVTTDRRGKGLHQQVQEVLGATHKGAAGVGNAGGGGLPPKAHAGGKTTAEDRWAPPLPPN